LWGCRSEAVEKCRTLKGKTFFNRAPRHHPGQALFDRQLGTPQPIEKRPCISKILTALSKAASITKSTKLLPHSRRSLDKVERVCI
jgi:hypothetical protein